MIKSLSMWHVASVCLAAGLAMACTAQSQDANATQTNDSRAASINEPEQAVANQDNPGETPPDDADFKTPGPELVTYSWASHIETLGTPDLGSPTGGVGIQDDFRATHRRVEGIIGFDETCTTLSGRFTFVNIIFDEQSAKLDPSDRSITYFGKPETPLVEPTRLGEGDWVLADVLRAVDPAINDASQNDAVASVEFASTMADQHCTSPHWVVILDIVEHVPQEVWNPAGS